MHYVPHLNDLEQYGSMDSYRFSVLSIYMTSDSGGVSRTFIIYLNYLDKI